MNALSRLIAVSALAGFASACTTLPDAAPGQSYRDQPLTGAPHYAGPLQRHEGRLLAAPVAIDLWTVTSLAPEARIALEALNAELDRALAQAWNAPVLRGDMPAAGRPKVAVGVPPDDGALEFADVQREPDGRLSALIRTWTGSRAWRDWARETLAREQADLLLMVWTGVGLHYPVQAHLLGGKRLPIGTGHAPSLPWLTALDEPVEVVQLTGLLVDRDGRVVRSGAEGMIAVPTRFAESVLGLQRTVQAADLRALPARVRDDLPGRPRMLEVALDHLVAQLTGRTERLHR